MSEIKERPILMSAPMVIACMREVDPKSQTRRVAKFPSWVDSVEQVGKWFTGNGVHPRGERDHPKCAHLGGTAGHGEPSMFTLKCPYGKVGDRLWVKEAWTGTWHTSEHEPTKMHLYYRTDGSERFTDAPADYVLPKAAAKAGNFVTPLFMPRWASRITLEITDVRVQKIQDVSDEDCIAEGVGPRSAKALFRGLWTTINGLDSWEANPFVWCISFRRV